MPRVHASYDVNEMGRHVRDRIGYNFFTTLTALPIHPGPSRWPSVDADVNPATG